MLYKAHFNGYFLLGKSSCVVLTWKYDACLAQLMAETMVCRDVRQEVLISIYD